MKQFALTTRWHLDAPIERVWDALYAVEQWPRWWRYVIAVVEIDRSRHPCLPQNSHIPVQQPLPASCLPRHSHIPVQQNGDALGVGSLRRYTWSSRLPYRLSFNMRTTVVARPTLMEGIASGDLDGNGRWRLESIGDTTRVQYEWTVVVGKPWMRAFAPLLAPVFAWNHD